MVARSPVRVDRGARGLVVIPVPEHHAVAAGAEFAPLAASDDASPVRVHDLHFDVRVHGPDRGDPFFNWIVYPRLG